MPTICHFELCHPTRFGQVLDALIKEDITGTQLLGPLKMQNNCGWTAFIILAQRHPAHAYAHLRA